MAAIWAFMPSDGFAVLGQWFYNKVVQLLLHLPYSRKLEMEADEVGLHLAAKAIRLRQSCQCAPLSAIDPRGQTEFLRNIIHEKEKAPLQLSKAPVIPAPAS
ncbi:hypothetical protein NP493_745g01028 [Ridgeia piscesae]|uniref:Peptidase M48 domain-containing protein n=1 Tax=Ridgeia piscesae TaxID=27915 RepID=A0AAD9KPY9_RIDPI|nr:hypothetical protein NP493_745g01028 [Ridgeia piscesae]